MIDPTYCTAPKLACITVSYNPDIALLKTQLNSLPHDCLKILVDNSSESIDEISRLKEEIHNLELVLNKTNLGLATAINQGVRRACDIDSEVNLVLFLDQDSEPQPDSIPLLIEAICSLKNADKPPGAVGPLLYDVTTKLSHGFHSCSKLRWYRVFPEENDVNPIPCTTLNGSGTMMSVALFKELGGLNEEFFIDHIDTEWSFRIMSKGYSLWGIPDSVFLHRMGDSSLRFWFFGWKVWPYRSNFRHYYLFRNAVILMKKKYVYKVWKFWALVKLLLTFFVHLLFDSNRKEQAKSMINGFLDGLKFKK